jgi:hypothetical protein
MTALNIGATDEARELVAAGEVKPGDKALDRPVSSMTDREIAEEMLIHARNSRDVVNGLVASIMSSPLGNMIAAKGGNPLSFFGG